ncbi:MAG TPA: hypothetical protein VKV38_12325 [Trebonia sp.]|nr:hypothetical protein [Trebonia sp.]
MPPEMHVHTGPARVFGLEDEAVQAPAARKAPPGDALVTRHRAGYPL